MQSRHFKNQHHPMDQKKNYILVATFVLLPLIFVSCNSSGPESEHTYAYLDSLYQQHQYFTLRNDFEQKKGQLNERDKLIMKAKIDAVFGKRELSNLAIDKILEKHQDELPDTLIMELLQTKARNSMLLGHYGEALNATQILLQRDSLLTDEEKADHENDRIIYSELRNTPLQAISLKATRLPITKDIAGLSRIPVVINSMDEDAVFDTGANISVITDSLAASCGMAVMDKSFKVAALSGQQVDAHIAIADSLRMGNTLLTNVVFMVFPKASLSFPQANYEIGAIIGYPVINALKEVQLIKNTALYIPENVTEHPSSNLALDFLTPIVEVLQDGRSLPFTFDTGASSTQLYAGYYQLHKEEINTSGVPDTVMLGGAGGAQALPIYKVPFAGNIGEHTFRVDTADVYYNSEMGSHEGVFGNLGQDVLQQYDTLTLNFDQMFLRVD